MKSKLISLIVAFAIGLIGNSFGLALPTLAAGTGASAGTGTGTGTGTTGTGGNVTCPNGTTSTNGYAGCYLDSTETGRYDLIDTLTLVINVIVGVVGFVAVVMIVLGGVSFLTSQGDTAKVARGRNTVLYGVIGLVVALLAFAIVNFVITNVF